MKWVIDQGDKLAAWAGARIQAFGVKRAIVALLAGVVLVSLLMLGAIVGGALWAIL